MVLTFFFFEPYRGSRGLPLVFLDCFMYLPHFRISGVATYKPSLGPFFGSKEKKNFKPPYLEITFGTNMTFLQNTAAVNNHLFPWRANYWHLIRETFFPSVLDCAFISSKALVFVVPKIGKGLGFPCPPFPPPDPECNHDVQTLHIAACNPLRHLTDLFDNERSYSLLFFWKTDKIVNKIWRSGPHCCLETLKQIHPRYIKLEEKYNVCTNSYFAFIVLCTSSCILLIHSQSFK